MVGLVFESIGYLGGLLITVAFIPQAMLAYKTKEVSSLSLSSYLILILAVICWIIYGAYLQDLESVIFNSISLVFDIILLMLIIKYRKK